MTQVPDPIEVRLRPPGGVSLLRAVAVPAAIGLATVALGSTWAAAGVGTGQLVGGLVVVAVGAGWLWQAWQRARRERGRRARLSGAPLRLRLDHDGVTVANGLPPDPAPAALSWPDLAAVVVSRLPHTPRRLSVEGYVQFVPRQEDLIAAEGGEHSGRMKGQLCGVSARAGLMVWLVPPGDGARVDEVLDRVRAVAPEARIVDSR